MKNRSVQEESNNKDSNKGESFVRGLEQTWYNKYLYIINFLISMLFHNEEITKKENSIYAQT